MVRIPPPEATCCVCMGRKQCVVERTLKYEIRKYDNFLYSEEHRGWLCKPCAKKLEKGEVAVVASGQRDFFVE